MDSEMARAIIAAIFEVGDIISNRLADIERAVLNGEPRDWSTGTHDQYLQSAQYLLESSYKNYQHPAGEIAQLSVDEMIKKLLDLGYNVIAPLNDPNFKINANFWVGKDPISPSDASTPPQPSADAEPPSST